MAINSAGNSRQELTLDQITFSKGRSKLEKCLIGVSIVLFILAIIFMILFIVYYLENEDKVKEADKNVQPEKKEDVCNTWNCLQTASDISQSIDPAVNPCDDFYRFACGKWAENNPIPPQTMYWEHFQELKTKLTSALREVFEVYDPEASEAVTKLRAFNGACVTAEKLLIFSPYSDEKDKACLTGTAPWLNLIGSGGANVFPTLEGDSWVDENWSFSEILARIPRRPGFNHPIMVYDHPIIHFSVQVDAHNAEKYILYFSQTKDYDFIRYQFLGDRNSFQVKSRESYYVLFLVAMGANSSLAIQDSKTMVDFEIEVAKATMPAPIDIKAKYKKMTIRELTNRYPQFDWLGYAQREMSSVGIDVTMDEEVAVDALDYFDKIFDVINSTSRRTLLNYCWWAVIKPYMDFYPKSVDENIKDTCALHTKFYFPDVASRLYVDKFFSEHTRKKVDDMIVDLQDSFKDILRGTDWMSEQTRQTALEKIDAIIDKVGYSDDVKNDTYLNEKTKDIDINVDDLLAFARSVGENTHRATLRQLRQRHDRLKWVTGSADVNAYYNPATNSIIFPAAILQKPVFRETVIDALLYGGIAFFIGHEITHGFDNQGANFDKDGNLHDWWQPEDRQEFQRRGECMVEQYSKFSFPEVKMSVNGRLTLGENIADNGGLKEAFWAYKKMVARKGKKDLQLPILGYTPEQLFFISTAQFWCVSMKNDVIPGLLQDVHTPNPFRVIGPMQNSVEFAKAFKCPVGSYMNPEKKCHVW